MSFNDVYLFRLYSNPHQIKNIFKINLKNIFEHLKFVAFFYKNLLYYFNS